LARSFHSLHKECFTTLLQSIASALFLKTAGCIPTIPILACPEDARRVHPACPEVRGERLLRRELRQRGREKISALHFSQVLSFHTLPHSFAFSENSTLFLSCDSALFCKNTRGWGLLMFLFPLNFRLSTFNLSVPRCFTGHWTRITGHELQ